MACLALATVCLTAHAEEDDFGVWTEVGATKVLPYGFSVSLEAGFRSTNKSKDVDRWSGSLSIGYKPNKYLKFGAGYMFLYEYSPASRKEDYKKYDFDGDGIETEFVDPRAWNGFNLTEDYWTPKNRFNVEVTGTVKYDILKISLRERYQYTHQKRQMVPRMKYRYKNDQVTPKKDSPRSDPNEKEEKHTQYLRSRLRFELDGKGWKFEPYVGFELFNDLDNKLVLDKTRFMVGTSYKINARNSVSLGYLFNNDVDEEPYEGKHVLDIGYSFKF